MDVISKIQTIIEPSLTDLGFEIVLLKMADGAKKKTLTLMTERLDGVMMSIADCTEISRTVSALMDVEDPITSAYDLEVCSPGIDRPLVKFSDFERHKNFEIKLESLIPVDGRKRFRGMLVEAKEAVVTMGIDGKSYEIAFPNIRSAKLVMTDALVESFMKQSKKPKKVQGE